MNQPITPCSRLLATWALAIGTLTFSMSIFAHELAQTIPDPGFRPQSEYAAAFLDTVGAAKIAVLPTLVRRTTRTAHSFESQQQIIAFLNESGISTALTNPRRIGDISVWSSVNSRNSPGLRDRRRLCARHGNSRASRSSRVRH